MRLYDNCTRMLRPFIPLSADGEVGLYTCGPTVYHHQHIGNFRTFLFEDILKRTLVWNGYRVRHVMNITDVGHLTSDADTGEDKMEKGARRTGKSVWEIAQFYSDSFLTDMEQLNIEKPTILCRATDHIREQIDFIADLEAKSFTYITTDGVYFDTSKLPDYGRLARLDALGLEAGKRIELGEKRRPTDFALWKFSPPNEHRQMEWETPGGGAFPAGTSNVRPWRRNILAISLIFIAAVKTIFRFITQTRLHRRRPESGRGSPTSGCTDTSCSRKTPKWPNQQVNS